MMASPGNSGLGQHEFSAKSVVLGALGQTSKFEPDCDKVRALEPEAEALVQQCKRALSNSHDPSA